MENAYFIELALDCSVYWTIYSTPEKFIEDLHAKFKCDSSFFSFSSSNGKEVDFSKNEIINRIKELSIGQCLLIYYVSDYDSKKRAATIKYCKIDALLGK